MKLNYKVTKMERDDYEEEKVPDTDEEEEGAIKELWSEFCDAVAQGVEPEILRADREKKEADKLFPGIGAAAAQQPSFQTAATTADTPMKDTAKVPK